MAPSPAPFWREVRAQAVAGTLVVVAASTLGGIAYLIHRVPSQLDRLLENQSMFKGRLEVLEREVDVHGERIIRLETKQ